MDSLPPLRFKPILREYLWGGRRLGTELNKPIGAGDHYAESWEIVDHGADQSIVADGSLAGTSLHDLVTQHGRALFGHHHPQRQFPLLFKFLDARETLSVQVHPNDEQGAKLTPPDLGKTEAWVVLAAQPGSKIYAGLKPGVDRQTLAQAIADGTCETCLHSFEPKVGDCIFIEAGTVHAIGAGLLIAELQQASDTTFRLFDWNRIDRDGRPRELHVEQALNVIDFNRGPVDRTPPQRTDQPHVSRLISCDKFVIDRWQLDQPTTLTGSDRFHIVSVVEGRVQLDSNMGPLLRAGDTLLIPAWCRDVSLNRYEPAVVLDMYLP